MKNNVFIFVVLLPVVVCQARIITVDANGPADFNNIQAAINNSNDGDVVIVVPGIYTGHGNRNINFGGKPITVRSTDPNDPNIVSATIIDCQGSYFSPNRGFKFRSGEGPNSVLDGLTITNGYVTYNGGGILCDSSSPTLINCTFNNNLAKRDGGGISCDSSSPTLINCTFKNNLAEQYGGGIFFNRSSPKLTNCTISDNKALSYSGGGICLNLSDPIISNCTISGNVVRREGGGICLWSSNPIIVNCIIVGNTAYDNYGQGGGISCWSSNPTIVSCTIMSNWAGEGGGGISCGYNSSPTITQCTIANNFAGTYGGAVYGFWNAHPVVMSSILYSNIASKGKQLALLPHPNRIIGPSNGTILYSNIQGGLSDVYVYNSTINWEEGNIDADPCFADPCNGDYHLLSDSPCINAGDPNFIAGPNDTDIDGESRVWDGRVDMGADEFVPAIEVLMKFTPQALNPKSKGNWVKAHLVLPEGFIVEDVDVSRPAVIEPLGIESDYLDVFINEDGLVEIEAGFDRAAFCAAGPIDGTVTVIGAFDSGQYFYGTDTIKIITNNLKYLGVLASRWLEQDCGKPDWCSGLDVDQDSVVNFVDFAMFDGDCIVDFKDFSLMSLHWLENNSP